MKRILALLLVVATIFAFAACKKTDKENNGKTTGGNSDTDAIADVITDGSSDSSESEFSSDGTLANNKKPGTRPTGNKTNLGTNTTVKPSQTNKPENRPTKHKYTIVVEKKNSKGMAEVITVDGTRYDLKNSNDIAALKKRVEDEKANDLLGQLYDVDPTITVQLGLNALDEGSVLSYKYDPEGEYFYVDDLNSWQQQFGFNPLYDFGAGFTVMYYDTVRIKFSYGTDEKGRSKDYMLQLWKGQYGPFGGGEVGVYTKDPETNDKLYNCADNDHLLNMYYDLYMTPNTYAVKDRFFYRDAWTGGGHWWLTGFKMGSVNPNEMVMSLKIRMRSRKMANAFEDGLQTAGFYRGNATSNYDSYYRNDTEFYILWYHTGNRNY